MLTLWRMACGLLLGTLLAACTAAPGPRPTATPQAVEAQNPLDGTEWVLSALKGQPPIIDSVITLNFLAGEFSGSAGCNRYGGSYQLDGNRIWPGMISNTLADCLGEAMMRQEETYLEVWRAAVETGLAYRLSGAGGNRLEILDGLGNAALVLERKEQFAMSPDDLLNTAWRLSSVDGRPPVEDSRLALIFLNEREFSGFAGCRHFYGGYQPGEAGSDNIRFTSIFMLGLDCHQNEPLSLQEGEFTDLLSRATDYHLAEGRLDLLTERGNRAVFLALPAAEATGPESARWRLAATFAPPPDQPGQHRLPTEPLPGAEITLAFEAGRASGSAGCNNYTSAYEMDDSGAVTFQPPGATKKMCAEPGGIMRQEQDFLALLARVRSYQQLDDQLWLETDHGYSLFFVQVTD